MGRIRQKVASGFQWHLKWVRIMITVSVLAVVVIIFIPQKKQEVAMMQIDQYTAADSLANRFDNRPLMDTTITLPDSSNARVLIRRTPVLDRHPASQGWYFDSVRNRWMQSVRVSREQPAPPPPPANDNKSDTVQVSTKTEPIQIQIVSEPKPFDWKGTITWLIGAINGLVLVVLNIKNLLFKKTP